jgi:hypothetical protein
MRARCHDRRAGLAFYRSRSHPRHLFFVIAGLGLPSPKQSRFGFAQAGPATYEFFHLKQQTPSWMRGPSPRKTR